MGHFGQQQQQQPQQQPQAFGSMGGPPAVMGQPTVNPTNPFNMAAAPPQQIPQQQQQQQLQQLFPGQQQQPQQPQQQQQSSFDISDEFLGLGGGGAAKTQEHQPERPAELAVGDPFRASTPASSGEPTSASAGGDGFGQGRIRQWSLSDSDLGNLDKKTRAYQII